MPESIFNLQKRMTWKCHSNFKSLFLFILIIHLYSMFTCWLIAHNTLQGNYIVCLLAKSISVDQDENMLSTPWVILGLYFLMPQKPRAGNKGYFEFCMAWSLYNFRGSSLRKIVQNYEYKLILQNKKGDYNKLLAPWEFRFFLLKSL